MNKLVQTVSVLLGNRYIRRQLKVTVFHPGWPEYSRQDSKTFPKIGRFNLTSPRPIQASYTINLIGDVKALPEKFATRNTRKPNTSTTYRRRLGSSWLSCKRNPESFLWYSQLHKEYPDLDEQ